MNRHQARKLAFSLLFEREFDRTRDVTELYDTAKSARGEEENKYVRKVLLGIAEHEEELETMIGEAAEGWSLSRISKVSLAILKLAVYEMRYCLDIPIRVSLNEAIELVKEFDEDSARGFVNGILNTLATRIKADRPDEA